MPIRKITFVTGEHYHVFNRGVDKRDIILDKDDVDRFIQSMMEFSELEPIGSIYENSFNKGTPDSLGCPAPKLKHKSVLLVSIVCFCLNPNHFHFILRQESEQGIEKFMQKLGGYPKYFNNKYKRSGALFQGKFKANHIFDNKYLLYLSAYVNLNNRVHQFGVQEPSLVRNSWEEFTSQKTNNFCKKNIILEQFSSQDDYKKFALDLLPVMIETKKLNKELEI